jgi:hypothetical protein
VREIGRRWTNCSLSMTMATKGQAFTKACWFTQPLLEWGITLWKPRPTRLWRLDVRSFAIKNNGRVSSRAVIDPISVRPVLESPSIWIFMLPIMCRQCLLRLLKKKPPRFINVDNADLEQVTIGNARFWKEEYNFWFEAVFHYTGWVSLTSASPSSRYATPLEKIAFPKSKLPYSIALAPVPTIENWDHIANFAAIKSFHALSSGRFSGLNDAERYPAATFHIYPGLTGSNLGISLANEPQYKLRHQIRTSTEYRPIFGLNFRLWDRKNLLFRDVWNILRDHPHQAGDWSSHTQISDLSIIHQCRFKMRIWKWNASLIRFKGTFGQIPSVWRAMRSVCSLFWKIKSFITL